MKLNYKRTICVGFAFFLICAFWQAYDNTVPLILTNKFGMSQAWSGVIMALDNILALFLLPLFGAISDRTSTKIGKRMPFILFGTGLAIILMNLLPMIDNSYAAAPGSFKTISFVVVLGLLLVAMGTYRSPAVALMPDVTPNPLRSRANAIINLMGALGGVFTLGVTGFLVTKDAAGSEDYTLLFLAVSILMAVSVVIVFLTIRENMSIRRFARIADGFSVPYVHMKGKIGVIVNLTVEGCDATEIGKDIAMQIAALNPRFWDKSQVTQDVLDEEKEVMLGQMANDPKMANKPDQVKEKIVMGKLNKFYAENCLLQQAFVKDGDVSVEQYMNNAAKALGGKVSFNTAVRFEKGEGIEKKQENFAAEIASMVNGNK